MPLKYVLNVYETTILSEYRIERHSAYKINYLDRISKIETTFNKYDINKEFEYHDGKLLKTNDLT